MSPSWDRRRIVDVALVASIGTAVICTPFGGPYWITASALVVTACLIWIRSAEANLLWYAATLPLPIPQGFAVIRLSIADLFMLPVIIRGTVEGWRRGERLPRSTMARPFILLLLTFLVGTLVGYWSLGRLTGYALLNKDAGLLFQIAAFAVLIRYAQTRNEVERLARWFVLGVSLTNVFALLAVVAAWAGFENGVYLVGNSRLYGWMGNPSINGGLLLTAAMIELGRLTAAPSAGERRGLRWTGLWLMALSLALTLSRSAWLAVASASGAMWAVLMLDPGFRPVRRTSHMAAVSIWFLLPSLMLGNIAAANFGVGFNFLPDERMAELREQLVGECLTDPTLDVCKDVEMSSTATAGSAGAARRAGAARSAGATVSVAPGAGANVAGPLMNARGLNDRIAILRSALQDYTANTRSILLGIGLGTFYATSAPDFGVPLIIHNTFAWFLVEFGPLGLIAIAWIWGQTTWNLWTAARSRNGGRFLALGALGAFAGLTAFCMFNEGFYQRQLWLVIALADRLRLLTGEGGAHQAGVSLNPRAQAVS